MQKEKREKMKNNKSKPLNRALVILAALTILFALVICDMNNRDKIGMRVEYAPVEQIL